MAREPALNQTREGIVANLVIHIVDVVRLVGLHPVDHVHTLAARGSIGLDPRRHITLVEHGLLHLQARVLHQHRIIDDRRRTGIAYPSVEPLGRVVAREVVQPQRKAEEAEHAVVGFLPQIGFQVRRFYPLVAGLYLHVVEQITAVGDMTRRAARHHHHDGNGYSTRC